MKLDPKALLAGFGTMQQELQDRLRQMEIEGSAGGGMVKVVMDGNGDIHRVSIDSDIIDPAEAELLEDLVRAAVNEARARSRERAGEEVRKLFGTLPFSDLLGRLPL